MAIHKIVHDNHPAVYSIRGGEILLQARQDRPGIDLQIWPDDEDDPCLITIGISDVMDVIQGLLGAEADANLRAHC